MTRAAQARSKEIRWDRELLEAVEGAVSAIPDAARRSMFGFPAFFASGKMFACVYQEEVGMRLPGELAPRLKREERFAEFCPMGHRPMREWVAVDRERALRGGRLRELLAVAAGYARANARAKKENKKKAAGKGVPEKAARGRAAKQAGRSSTERKVRS
ncbi:MAG TPA: TfoX/Sxy family protein [Myxococcales bacterium]